jgi:hypothetical protein
VCVSVSFPVLCVCNCGNFWLYDWTVWSVWSCLSSLLSKENLSTEIISIGSLEPWIMNPRWWWQFAFVLSSPSSTHVGPGLLRAHVLPPPWWIWLGIHAERTMPLHAPLQTLTYFRFCWASACTPRCFWFCWASWRSNASWAKTGNLSGRLY